jgi:hypothetical protein
MSISCKNILERGFGNPQISVSPLQGQVDGLVSGFVEEAANPRTLVAITAGGFAYRLGRLGVMGLDSSLFAGPGSLAIRPFSLIAGLASEVTVFEFTNRFLTNIRASRRSPLQDTSGLWSWSGPGGWREGLVSSALTFGLLRSAGWLAREQNLVLQHSFQASAMVAGHQVSGALGMTPSPEGSLVEQFLRAEITNLQMLGGASLVHGLAPKLSVWERVFTQDSPPFVIPRFRLEPGLAIEGARGPSRINIPQDEENPAGPLSVLMAAAGDGRAKGGGPNEPPSGAEPPEEATSLVFPPLSLEDGKEAPEIQLLEIIRRNFPEEIRDRVNQAASVIEKQIQDTRHKPILLMAQALAEVLDGLNRDLYDFPLNGDPVERSKILRLRNWIRDSFGEYLRLPGFAPVGVHYDRSLAYVSLVSLEVEASQYLVDPLSVQVLGNVRTLQELSPDDPRLSRDLRLLGSRIGAFSRDTYLAILDFALKEGLVTRKYDSVDNRLMNEFRRRYRKLHPQGFPPIELHRIEEFHELELMVSHFREKWGAYHVFLRGYDKEFGVLQNHPHEGILRYQILKRAESFLQILDRIEEMDEDE